jgi:hypothetical protein
MLGMNQRSETERDRVITMAKGRGGPEGAVQPSGRFPFTDMPTGLLLLLAAVGLPRTILADLDVVPPESGLLYYVLALSPFAVWLAVAVLRRSVRPFCDFLVLGAVYGLTLIAVHLAFWGAAAGYGNRPPAGAVDFAEQFSADWYDTALRAHISAVALVIGIGSGIIVALVAVTAHAWRVRRER